MTTNYDGGPAFARSATERNMGDAGMSLRDWYAGQPGITGSTLLICMDEAEILAGPAPESLIEKYKWQCKVDAILRYIAADAMIAARDAK